MNSSGLQRDDRPWIPEHFYSNSHTDQMGADFCHRLSSTHDSGLSVGHAQAFNSTGITPLAHPGASVPKTPFYARMYPKTDEVGSSFDFHPQESAYVIPPHVLSCSSYTPVPAMVSDNVYCSYGRHRGTGMYPARSPVEQWDTQAVQRPTLPTHFPAAYMQPLCVAPSPLRDKVADTSPASSIVRGDVAYDTGWSHDMGTSYPTYPERWDAQTFLGPTLGTTGDGQPTSATVAPSQIEDNATSTASTASTPKSPTHNTDKDCPICPASFRRPQDRKRHVLSHLPRWLQCQAPGCSWRGDRWEHLREHRLKVHLSNSQELDSRESIIYDPLPFVEGITNNATFENAKTIAISLVEVKAQELGKSELWGDLWGRKRSRKTYIQSRR